MNPERRSSRNLNLWLALTFVTLAVGIGAAAYGWYLAQPLAISAGLLLVSCTAVAGILWRRQSRYSDIDRQSLEGHYADLSRHVSDMVVLYSEQGRILAVNDRTVEAYGYSREELLGMSIRDLRDETELEALSDAWQTLMLQGWVVCEARHRRKDGSAMIVQINARIVDTDVCRFCQCIMRDVTEQRRAEEDLGRVSRALRVLSACNQAVVRTAVEDDLYREVCDAITGAGNYPMAWIGFPENEPGKPVRVVYGAGRGKGYLDSIYVSWSDEPHGQGVVGSCLRSGKITLCNDTENDPRHGPWRERAQRYGFKALIALPLWCEGTVFGALTIYAPESDAFHSEERNLLEELAADVSYGVETRRRRLEQEKAENALRKSEQDFRALFDNVSDAVFIIDTECRFLEVNRVACERLGYSRDELVRMSIRDIDGSDYADLTPDGLARLVAPGQALLETVHLRRDGSRFPVEINARMFEYRGAPALLSVARDISERKKAEAEASKRAAELERARAEAERASRAKSEFLAHMSHEIRTPLNGILGMTNLLFETPLDSEQREFGETVRTSGQALLSLVNDLLDISRIEAGRIEIEPTRFDLAACLESTGELMAPQARAKGLQFVFDAEMVCRGVVGDTGRIRQIVLNLLGNAIKFTEEGHVTLRVRGGEPDNGRAEFHIEVEDTGPGIPPDKAPLLFHNFTQLDSSLVRKHEGAGLGLAISRQLAELMGGSLTLTSLPGRGSTFLLTLPLNTFEEDSRLGPAPAVGSAVAASDGRILRVLLVEDNAVNQRLGVRILDKLGCSIDVASNGLEAIEMALGGHYDLILMDCRMPEMDGYAATREIRRREEAGARVPIIALTAHAVTGAREECIAAGMDDFITKPLLVGDLEKVLGRWGGTTLDSSAKHRAGLKENTV
jgi:PAS domain S-box-containing protein